MAEKPQFKFYAEPHLVDRLERLARKCGLPSAQKFAIAALDGYAELLADLLLEGRDQAELFRKRQRDQLTSKCGQGQESGADKGK